MGATVSSVNVVLLAALASCSLLSRTGAEASPEVTAKAVLVACQELPSESSPSGSAVEGFLSSKPTLTGCKRKLGIVLRINNTGQYESEDLYVFLDEAIDQTTNESVKLLEPIVVKMHQHPVVLAHAFHYLGSVCGKLAETVYTAKNLTEPDSLGACYSNDLSGFQCGYDEDDMFPKVRRQWRSVEHFFSSV
ncbi:hypothetical protein HPB48_013158 [Haemaphysalis longicornis]|uniref:Generative cell specific-1/HAP2 domain-containing protein n=1 Tax=Haemaphysalis longicornis TaxID=44386 RepID=A0A9J6GXW2_HAELO|nr:hypothetical protein HPB48_013158 [Haemaphysalis longicornis]